MIQITNHGPLITASDYWQSPCAATGKLLVSPNAGAIRCLLPPAMWPVVGELRAAEYAIVSLGPWSDDFAVTMHAPDIDVSAPGVEILWEDHTDSPHTWHVTANSCLMLPGDPGEQEWIITCWVERRGEPHKALERPCHWRRADSLPCLKPWRAT